MLSWSPNALLQAVSKLADRHQDISLNTGLPLTEKQLLESVTCRYRDKRLTNSQLMGLLTKSPGYGDYQYQQDLIRFTYQLTHYLSRAQLRSCLRVIDHKFTETARLVRVTFDCWEADEPPIYLIKGQNDQADALHELIIGLYVANQLRAVVPNFACIYGWSGLNKSFSNHADQELLLYYEQIPGPELEKYSQTCTKQQFIKAYL